MKYRFQNYSHAINAKRKAIKEITKEILRRYERIHNLQFEIYTLERQRRREQDEKDNKPK